MKTFTLRNFELQCGAVLPEAEIIYETYGELAGDRGRQQSSLGLEYVDSAVDLDYSRCFQFMRTDDQDLFDIWSEA